MEIAIYLLLLFLSWLLLCTYDVQYFWLKVKNHFTFWMFEQQALKGLKYILQLS